MRDAGSCEDHDDVVHAVAVGAVAADGDVVVDQASPLEVKEKNIIVN